MAGLPGLNPGLLRQLAGQQTMAGISRGHTAGHPEGQPTAPGRAHVAQSPSLARAGQNGAGTAPYHAPLVGGAPYPSLVPLEVGTEGLAVSQVAAGAHGAAVQVQLVWFRGTFLPAPVAWSAAGGQEAGIEANPAQRAAADVQLAHPLLPQPPAARRRPHLRDDRGGRPPAHAAAAAAGLQ